MNRARIVLGVSGGIAAYKAADLASKLVQLHMQVDVIMTKNAQQFIKPLTFQALTKRPVHTDIFETWSENASGHISLAHEADLLVIAPASANTIARLSLGLADDMLTTVALATTAPLIIVPAMEHNMFHHPATQQHLATLRSRGAHVMEPEVGRLASGRYGDGRLAAVDTIVGAIRFVLGKKGALVGKHLVVTAGGTKEPIDPVRFLGNRSSGIMGYAIAQAAIDQGATVSLVSAPTNLAIPYGANAIQIETAKEMLAAVKQAVKTADAFIAVAAVTDFRPTKISSQKIKKMAGQKNIMLELEQNDDILRGIHKPDVIKIGFAAETENLIQNARKKMKEKNLTMVIANDAVKTIGSQKSTATIINDDGSVEKMPTLLKTQLADKIIERLIPILTVKKTNTQ